jgi:hypothetical protein
MGSSVSLFNTELHLMMAEVSLGKMRDMVFLCKNVSHRLSDKELFFDYTIHRKEIKQSKIDTAGKLSLLFTSLQLPMM